MSPLHTDGGLASNDGRPLGSIFIAPSYTVTFYNKTLDAPLTKVGFVAASPYAIYNEGLGDANVAYSKVLHYTISNATTGQLVNDFTYAPYIDSYSKSDIVMDYHLDKHYYG